MQISFRRARRLATQLPTGTADARRMLGIEQATRRLLLGGVLPLWLGAGLADWYLHRRTRIERTAGPRESAVHWLMFTETGVPVMFGLFFEVNAGVLAAAIGGWAVHEAAAYWDQAYAEPRHRVRLVEQMVHSSLEVSPLMAAYFLAALHWDQLRAVAGPGRPDFRLRSKQHPLTLGQRAGVLAAVTVFGVLPYAEEMWRCWRACPTLRRRPQPPETAGPAEATGAGGAAGVDGAGAPRGAGAATETLRLPSQPGPPDVEGSSY